MKLTAYEHPHKTFKYRNLKKLNENEFRTSLADSPWDAAFIFEDIDDCLHAWENIFLDVVNSHVPIKEKRVSREKQPHWMTDDILKLMKQRDNLLKKARKRNDYSSWKSYRAARNSTVNKIKSAKRKYFLKTFKDNKGDPKTVWKLIKSLGGNVSQRQPISLSLGNKQTTDHSTMADLFNTHFTTVTNTKSSLRTADVVDLTKVKESVSSKLCNEKFFIPPITDDKVMQYIQKIPSNKAVGIDGISIKLLKIGVKEISPSISKLINMSIASQQFPTKWKLQESLHSSRMVIYQMLTTTDLSQCSLHYPKS